MLVMVCGFMLGSWHAGAQFRRPMPPPMSEHMVNPPRMERMVSPPTASGEDPAACAAQLEEAFTLIQALTRRLVANGGSRILAEGKAQQAIEDMLRMRAGASTTPAEPPAVPASPPEGG